MYDELDDAEFIARDDLASHPEAAKRRPHPIGIAGTQLKQIAGTERFVWYAHMPSGWWMPKGPCFTMRDTDEYLRDQAREKGR